MSFALVFAMIPGTAFAEVSDTEPIFQYLAPKSQTTYKQVLKDVRSVEDVKVQNEEIMAISGRVAAWGAIASGFTGKIGATIGVAGGVLYLVGDAQMKTLKAVKEATEQVVEYDFKWTYTKSYPLKGTFRMTTYFTCNGVPVGESRVTYQNREFALGERWNIEEERETI